MARPRRKPLLMRPTCCYCGKRWPVPLPEGVDATRTPCPGCSVERRKAADVHFMGTTYRTTADGQYVLAVRPKVASLPDSVLTLEQKWARWGYYTTWNDTVRAYYVASCRNLDDAICKTVQDVEAWILQHRREPEEPQWKGLDIPDLPPGVHLSSVTGSFKPTAAGWARLLARRVTLARRFRGLARPTTDAAWAPNEDTLRVVLLERDSVWYAMLVRSARGWDLYVCTPRKVDWIISRCPTLERVWPVACEELMGQVEGLGTKLARLRYKPWTKEDER